MTFDEQKELWLKSFTEQKDYINERCERDIEKYRKGDCVLKFGGKDIKNIKIKQKTHDFKYGANIFLLDEFENEWENKAYRELFKKYFNLATVPFYWDALEPEEGKPRFAKDSKKIYRRPAPDLCVDYCKESGIDAKLHCLFYDKFVPDWAPMEDKEQMKKLYEKRISEITERYSGKLYEFEVTNETLLSPGWTKKSVLSEERDIIEWAFDLAKKYLKNETLVINEGNPLKSIFSDGYYARYFMQLEKLLAKGTPIDKIGIQNHVFTNALLDQNGNSNPNDVIEHAKEFMNPEIYFKTLDMLSEFGLPLELTEVTVATLEASEAGEELQADVLEYLFTIWFSIPLMETVVYWNTVDNMAYIDGSRWDENKCLGGLFHRDLTPKKSAERLYYLFNEKWNTQITAKAESEFSFRGFYGEYEAEIDGKIYNFGIHKDSDNIIEINL